MAGHTNFEVGQYYTPIDPLEEQQQGAGFFEGLLDSVNQYYTLGGNVEELFDLLDADLDDEKLDEGIKALEEQRASGAATQAMLNYQREVEKQGGGFFGALKAAFSSPDFALTALQVNLGSLAGSIRTAGEVLTGGEEVASRLGLAAGAGATVGAGAGAAFGSGAGPIGTALGGFIGAKAGATRGAYAATSGMMEGAGKIAEEIMKYTNGDLSKESVRAVLEDPEKLRDIKSKVLGRGLSVAAADFAFMGLGKGVGTMATQSASKAGRRIGTVAGEFVGEGIGGAVGEAAAQVAADEEYNPTDIVLEASGGLGAGLTTIASSFDKSYVLNKQPLTKNQFLDQVNEMNNEDVVTAEIFTPDKDPDVKNIVREKRKKGIEEGNIDITDQAVPVAVEDLQTATKQKIIELQESLKEAEDTNAEVPIVDAIKDELQVEQEKLSNAQKEVKAQIDLLSTDSKINLLEKNAEYKYYDKKTKSKKTTDKQKEVAEKKKQKAKTQGIQIFMLSMVPQTPKQRPTLSVEEKEYENIVTETKSEKASNEVQKLFDEKAEPDYEFSIIEEFKPIVAKLVEKRKDAPGFDRQLLTDEIETGAGGILDLIRSYDPDKGVPLAAYINSNLPKRAIRASERVLDTKFTEDTDNVVVQDQSQSIEQQIDEQAAIEENTIETGKKINLPESLVSKIASAAKLALMTSKQKVDALKFNTDIAKTLKDKLYKEVKDFFGRDTKAEATFTNTLENNAEALYDVLRPEAMAMARDGKKNPFEEAGFFKNGEKVKFSSVGKEAFVNYFKGIGLQNKQARANRKIRLAEALAVSLGANEAISLLKNDQTVKDSFIESQKRLEPTTPESVIEEATDFGEETQKTITSFLNKLGYSGKDNYGNSKENINQYFDAVESFLRLLPEDIAKVLTDKSEALINGRALEGLRGQKDRTAIANAKQKELFNKIKKENGFADSIEGLDLKYITEKPKDLFKNNYKNEKKLKEINDANQKVGRIIAEALYNYVLEDPANRFLPMLSVGQGKNSVNFWWNNTAEFVGYEKGAFGTNFVIEHAVPKAAAWRALLNGARLGLDFDSVFNPLMDNYKTLAVSKKTVDQGLLGELKNGMRKGWTLADSWLDRYKGLDLNNFINTKDGQNFLKQYNLYVEGKQTPDIKSTQQKGVQERTSDGFELLIERAIANLQKLTGAPGTLQTNIAAIPTSLLIGALRTVKLAYKGGKAITSAISEGYKLVKDFISEQEWSDFVKQSTYEVSDQKTPAEKQLAILSEKGVREAQEKVRKENEKNLSKLGEKTKNQSTDKIISDLKNKKDEKVKQQKDKEPNLAQKALNIFKARGATKRSFFRRFNIYVPPGADDFAGLLYTFYQSGKVGEQQMKFFEEYIMTPFAKGINAYEAAKVAIGRDYRALKKRYKNKSLLKQTILDGQYTNEDAVRAYLFSEAGQELGISEADQNALIAAVVENNDLLAFAQDLSKITKTESGYANIYKDWEGGNIDLDLNIVSQTQQRKEFLAEFLNNKEQIFSKENMKVIKQLHGEDFTDALSNVLTRMETGVNRKQGKDKEFNSAMNWLNQSVANIMAVNVRSAILQQLSIVNFMNFTHNNPIAMAKAMGNTKQFTEDFIKLWNSSFLTDRRGGQKIELNTADIADSQPGNWFLRTNKKLLELGFKPTQWGDSFAISFGGATWYRNRINQLVNQGVDPVQAEEQTMIEFQEIAEETQQSSRPDRISRQQASDIGRLILAFANTPLQYARLTKKATLDLINGRGDWRTNASKILYYGAAQNIIFSGLQSALFSLLLSDNEDDEKDEKKLGFFANTIFDGFLRGMGYSGAVVAALKNLGQEYYSQQKRKAEGKRVADPALRLIQKGLTISPPVSKKIGDIIEAQRFENWRQYKEDPFYQYFAKANYISGLTNVPLDRAFKKAENLRAISIEQNDAWQNIFLALGWSPYQLDVEKNIQKGDRDLGKRKKSKLKRKVLKRKNPINRIKTKDFGILDEITFEGDEVLDPIEPPIKKIETKDLGKGIMGRANNDGTIEVDKNLSPKQKKKVIAHEQQHQRDMKSGKLNYDDDFVYWKGSKYPRVGGKIEYNNKKYIEGHPKLPWEEAANKVERQVS